MRTVRTEDRILAVPAEMSTLSSDLGQPIKIDDSGKIFEYRNKEEGI